MKYSITPKISQQIAFGMLLLSTLIVVLPVVFIIITIIIRGLPAINWTFLTDMPREGMRAGGIFPSIIGTLYLVIGAIIVALPWGIMAAVYLTEYARQNILTRLIQLAVVNLAGVPSIVYGLFGLGLFVLLLKFGVSLLAGSLTLAIMILPVIIASTQEALIAVPQAFREASLALGATKWQTIRHCVLPYALPGILTGTILSISRAAGETAPILFTAAAFYLPHLPKSIFDQVMALPYHLYVISTQIPGLPLSMQYGTALVFVVLVFGMSLLAIIIRWRFRRSKKW